MSTKRRKSAGVGPQGPSHRVLLRQQQAIAARKKKERMILLLVAGVVVLGMVIGGVVLGLRQIGGDPTTTASPGPVVLAPQPVVNGRPVTFGDPAAPTKLDIFADFQCPHCVDFEKQYGPMIKQAEESGKVHSSIYPMAFINAASGRLANGFACAATEGYQRPFFEGAFQNSDLEWTPEQQFSLVRGFGSEPSPAFIKCVNTNAKAPWIGSIAETATQRGVTGTPTMFVNGQQVEIPKLNEAAMRQLLGL